VATITLSGVGFQYPRSPVEVFSDLNLSLDTTWKTGLVGNNGMGKTTLFRLLHGEIQAARGTIEVPIRTHFFPYAVPDPSRPTLAVIRDSIAPFNQWEREMEVLLREPTTSNLELYGELLQQYQALDGYGIDARIKKELVSTGVSADLLERPYHTLSGGEQTRALIIPLFIRPGELPLIDEPTNHLDMAARDQLAHYLSAKGGFILISHDRAFLDQCVDHIVSLNRADVRVNQGTFSDWHHQMALETEHERRRSENLQRQVRQLEAAARKRRVWSGRKEKQKKGALDKGRVGKLAARVMKRALSIERRVQQNIDEKRTLLQNVEKERQLRLETHAKGSGALLQIECITVIRGARTLIDAFSLEVQRGDRIAIVGPNGSGKTTLLAAICGEIPLHSGCIRRPARVQITRAFQSPIWCRGRLKDHLLDCKMEETRFRQILGVMGVSGEVFERPLETFSQGQLKKVDLCRSFLNPSHLLLWDEPLNYVDLMSREQIENVVLESRPTLLFIEHDRYFVEEVATKVVVAPLITE